MKNLSWNAPEYHHTPKTAEWFLASGIIVLACIVTAAFLGNVLFATVITLAALSLFFYAHRAPEIVVVSLAPEGIHFGKILHGYDELAAFGIEEDARGARLLLRKKKKLSLLVAIPIVGIHPNLVRAALTKELPEEELREPLSQKLLEYLGF